MEKNRSPSAAERLAAMDKKIDEVMADISKNGDRSAANTPLVPGIGSWNGDGEIMQDFDPNGRVYANGYDYDNRDIRPTNAWSGSLEPDMQRVIIPGKRMTSQEQEDFDKDAMRRSMLPFLQQPKRAKASVVQPRQSKGNQALERQWNAAKNKLVDASYRAKVDPGVMAEIAAFESRFNPNAQPISSKASLNRVRQFDGTMAISSAHGYGQFTDASWTDSIGGMEMTMELMERSA